MMSTHENGTKKFTTKRIVFIALFVALSYALSFFSFPIFPATPYMKLDFSNVFILLTGLLFGPVEGIIVCVLKEIIGITNSSSGGVGELANAIMTTSFILLPSLVYRIKKSTKAAIISLIPACLIGTAVALVTNRFIIFPMYMGDGAAAVFESAFWFAVAFNLIKTASISLITGVMFKRLSYFVKKYRI
ncbi:MAG: ECF transporter S component [Clostridia bacterium]|nr:ECF transporter S component [Clostridia bacterium]